MVEAVKEVPFTPPVQIRVDTEAQKRHQQSVSSIGKADGKVPFKSSKPILDPPMPVWQVLNEINRLEDVANQYGITKERSIDHALEKIQQCYQDESIKLDEELAASENVSFWGLLEDLTSTITSSVSLYFGISALSTGGAAVGGVLIVSGVASLGNLAFKYTKGWDWVADQVAGENKGLRDNIRTYLPAAIGLTCAAIGIYGSYSAWKYAAETGVKQSLSVIQTTGNLAGGLAACASGRAQSHFTWTNAELSSLQTKADISRIDLENLVEETKTFHQKQMEINELANRLVEATNQAIQITQQPV